MTDVKPAINPAPYRHSLAITSISTAESTFDWSNASIVSGTTRLFVYRLGVVASLVSDRLDTGVLVDCVDFRASLS